MADRLVGLGDRVQVALDEDPGSKSQPYGGLNPHIDHIHVEVSVEGGEGQTPWFDGD